MKGFFIDTMVSGNYSAKKWAAVQAMLVFYKNNDINTIIFYDFSRLGRNLEETLYELKRLIEEGYNIYFVYPDLLNQIDDPMMKKLVVSMFAWFAELYRYDIIQRTKAGILRAKPQGKHISRPRKEIDWKKFSEYRRKGLSLRDYARLLMFRTQLWNRSIGCSSTR